MTKSTETDIIGGFTLAVPECQGCGKQLLIENAWMADGCPCNSTLGVNNQNETRWRLLLQLQQEQRVAIERLISELDHANRRIGTADAEDHSRQIEAQYQRFIRDKADSGECIF